jgi:RNA-directed DNA polymerase
MLIVPFESRETDPKEPVSREGACRVMESVLETQLTPGGKIIMMSKDELSMLTVSTKQQRIAKIAKQNSKKPLTQLHHYIDESWLNSAFHQLNKDSVPGIDGVTVKEYSEGLEKRLKRLLNLAKSGKYQAPAVRGTKIPKPGSKEFRPLGIPITEDKILQKAIQMVLDPVYEQEFYEFSFGFRKGKSTHQGLEYVWKQIMDNRIQWIIDLDIRKFFDTVKHNILQDLLSERVRDGVIIRLIGKWLNAGVMKDGSVSFSDEGTPQGGVISPLLSNIYLHEALDKWYMLDVRPRLRKRSFMVRYADDAILGFENRMEAEQVMGALKQRLAQFGLELHPEKTRLLYFGKPKSSKDKSDPPEPGNFDFLGFTHYWGKSLKGNWIVKRKTARKKFREKLANMTEWCKENRNYPIREQYKTLCRKIKGHYAYYGITNNVKCLSQYLYEVTRIWKKWLSRRSWRGKRLNWERFSEWIKNQFPLPHIRLPHSIYSIRSKAIT